MQPQPRSHIRWNHPNGRQFLLNRIEESNFVLVGDLPEKLRALSNLQFRCTACDALVVSSVTNFLDPRRQPPSLACNCSGLLRVNTPCGRARLQELAAKMNFEIVNINKKIANTSTITVKCKECDMVNTPIIKNFAKGVVGCLCNNSIENIVFQFVSSVVSTHFKERRLRVDHQYTDVDLRGVGGRVLRFDIVVLDDAVEGRPILFVEPDGGHHFSKDIFDNGEKRHTFEHDVAKEHYVVSKSASMARIETDTIRWNKREWSTWLQGLIEAAESYKLPPSIYRLSSGPQYVSGTYAKLRQGTSIDPLIVIQSPHPVATPVAVPILHGQAKKPIESPLKVGPRTFALESSSDED